ncbi:MULTISPECIES: DMT family transporter [unclassified Micromonospora]|uniref:DMT family transporter n=1 Tax=unclassified Micromonospora TaxID=2617518 RepID=UPI0022CC319C|nr:DMT family transporter [Micromonospora sp. AKA38]GHJ16021.1 membrane protein [Micromonospora sp. AKA38]
MIFYALAGAFSFALSAALHQRAATRQPRFAALDPRLLLRLFRDRLWLSGWIPDTAGVVFQVLALRAGALAVVQPVMASGLFMAVLIEAVIVGRRIARRDLIAVAVGVAGLTAFLLLADVRAGVPRPPPKAWTVAMSCATAVIAACVLAARRRQGAARGALLGVASGVAYSFAAALVKDLTGGPPGSLLTAVVSWRSVALVVAVALGLMLNQAAFQHGRLAAPLTALTLTDPVVSVLVAVTVFRETLSAEPMRVVGLVLAAVTVGGGVWLAASACSTGPHEHRRR